MKSIKTKLVLLLSLFILTSSISIGITSIRASTRTAVKKQKTLSSIARESAKLTKSRIDSQKMIVEILAINEGYKSMDWEKQGQSCRNMQKKPVCWTLPLSTWMELHTTLTEAPVSLETGIMCKRLSRARPMSQTFW